MNNNQNKIQPMDQTSSGKKGPLVLLIGAVATAGLYVSIPKDESGRKVEATIQADGSVTTKNIAGKQYLTPYRDIVGVWTVCDGDTKNVKPGVVETTASCQKRLEQQLLAHAVPVMNCTPRLAEPGRDYQRWAAISLAYNIGVGAYCRSSVDRNFDAGKWRAGCDAMLMWNKAGGRVIPGLQRRRNEERAICLKGL